MDVDQIWDMLRAAAMSENSRSILVQAWGTLVATFYVLVFVINRMTCCADYVASRSDLLCLDPREIPTDRTTGLNLHRIYVSVREKLLSRLAAGRNY